MSYETDGVPLFEKTRKLKLVDPNYITLLVPDGIKNKKSIKPDTFTHILVGIQKQFTATLKNDGAISRNRFVTVYPLLAGAKHSTVDFFKYLDTHTRRFIHGQPVRKVIHLWLSNKAALPTHQISNHIDQIELVVLEYQNVLIEHFNLRLINLQQKGEYIFDYIGTPGLEEIK